MDVIEASRIQKQKKKAKNICDDNSEISAIKREKT